MILVQMGGRLGNQLFNYAAARSLQINLYPNEELVFDFGYLSREGTPQEGWVNGLAYYNTVDYRLYEKNGVMLHAGSIYQKAICAAYYAGLRKYSRFHMNEEYEYEKKWSPVLNAAGIYWYRTGYIELTSSKARNKLMSGRFEDSRYFNSIREELLKELTPRYPELATNEEIYSIADAENSVCVSIRRGDFETNQTYKKLHSVCTRQYFEKAIRRMREMFSNPVFLLFSDDVSWAKQNIVIPGAEVYAERGDDPVWEKLRMMSRCNHFIISNSSFSWWSQWLSTRSSKVVIAPNRWFNNDYNSPLIEKNMIRIDVDSE